MCSAKISLVVCGLALAATVAVERLGLVTMIYHSNLTIGHFAGPLALATFAVVGCTVIGARVSALGAAVSLGGGLANAVAAGIWHSLASDFFHDGVPDYINLGFAGHPDTIANLADFAIWGGHCLLILGLLVWAVSGLRTIRSRRG